jgi:DNA-binding NtrC family response regulator/tetratricopeptide (TPR) repeat protein
MYAVETLEKNSTAGGELEEIRLLIDKGLSGAAQARLNSFIGNSRKNPALLAQANCLLSESLELQGAHQESFEVLRHYETSGAVASFDVELKIRVRVRLSLAYSYTGDFPKAIALLNDCLRELKKNQNDALIGAVSLALSRVYRTINEYPIARDHAEKALAHFRQTGEWRGLAESYFALALVELFEGEYEPAHEHLEQVLNLVGSHPASHLLGMTYINLAAICWFLKRGREGVSHIKKAIGYYETTEHKTNAVAAYNNLGIHLMLTGEWREAEEALQKALELANGLNARNAKLPMILDSMGELKILRGELQEAREYLERAVRITEEHQNKWYAWQSLRTLSKCFLAEGETDKALEAARKVLALGEKIGDQQAVREARLLIAESYLQNENLAGCERELCESEKENSHPNVELALIGELCRLQGALAIKQNKPEVAQQHFSRSVSVFETLGDRYRLALAQFRLGCAFAATRPDRAHEYLTEAAADFQKMGARVDLERTLEFLKNLPDRDSSAAGAQTSSLIYAFTERLTQPGASRELLLHELFSILRQETKAARILILTQTRDGDFRIVARNGMTAEEGEKLSAELSQAKNLPESALAQNYFVHKFCPVNAAPAILLMSPSEAAVLPENLPLEPLLRLVELGLTACAAHENALPAAEKQKKPAPSAILSGSFIYASPVMERFVGDIRKIRSSDVTVLVTGESGTGKELVAQAVHQLSARREQSFIPFNCTAVPRELSDAHLFGYRRGAFTGANTDSPGVIRAASGGTLFLDEVGDLPLEIQPKLLRFLQEGEIQPLGEQRPVKVDVRVVAATNADLEQMVRENRFREDLYYRLNVIRLHVPALRERRSDIAALVAHYLDFYTKKFGLKNVEFAPQTVDLLMVGDWHGNVRQLCNEIQRLVARAEDNSVIMPAELSPELRAAQNIVSEPSSVIKPYSSDCSLPDAVDYLEKEMIGSALERTNHNISRAAQILGITRRGLQLKLKR